MASIIVDEEHAKVDCSTDPVKKVLPQDGVHEEPKANKHVSWTSREQRQWCSLLFTGTLVCYSARVAVPICASQISKEYGWSKSQTGTVLSSFFWGYSTTQLLGGLLADRIGGDRVLGITTCIWSLLIATMPQIIQLSYALAAPLFWVTIARVLTGITQGMHFPSTSSLIGRRVIMHDRGHVFGLICAGSHFGSLACGSVGSLLLEYYGWRSVFYSIGFSSIAWWIALRYYSAQLVHNSRYSKNISVTSKPRLRTSSVGEIVHSPSCARIVDAQSSSATDDDEPLLSRVTNSTNGTAVYCREKSPSIMTAFHAVPWRNLLSRPEFWAAACAHYCGANAYFSLMSWLPTYFSETFPGANGWVFNVLPHTAVTISASLAPYLASKVLATGVTLTRTRKMFECTSLLGLAFCLLIVGRVQSYPAALVCMTAAMFIRGFHHAGVTCAPQEYAPNHAGVVFGLQNTFSALPGFIGVYVAGWILQLSGSWAQVFGLVAVQCIVGAVIYGLYGTSRPII